MADQGEKDAVLAAHPEVFFTIPHFDGYPAILMRLTALSIRTLDEAIIDGWLACAPAALAAEWLRTHPIT